MSMTWNLKNYLGQLANYTELRAQNNKSFRITLLNGEMVANASASESGISARSFFDGQWGFASHPQIDKTSIERVLSEAQKNANFMAKHGASHSSILKMPGAKATIDLSEKSGQMSLDDIIKNLKEIDGFILDKYADVSNRTITSFQQDFIKEGINSEGALTYTHYIRSFTVIMLGMNSPNGPVEVKEVLGGPGPIQKTFPKMDLVKMKVEELYGHLKNKVNGVSPEGGVKEVILSSKLAGILAHEAIGHTTEADIVLGGSIAGENLGMEVASPLVDLVDFAHTVLGQQAPMPVLFDDEGTLAEDTVIIEKGILKSFMNSKETAQHFSQKATGHARAWGFSDEPIIRMRNTAILPGKSKLEDMISSVEDGYYLIDHSNGQADSTSEFMFGVTMGYEIKKGKLGRALLDSTISGIAFDMLKSVTMVSDEMTWVSSGTCGKKQPMTVGMGGPALRCKINIGGR